MKEFTAGKRINFDAILFCPKCDYFLDNIDGGKSNLSHVIILWVNSLRVPISERKME